jgi:hypothetical protein
MENAAAPEGTPAATPVRAALWARVRPALAAIAAFGSPGNMAFAALLGAGAFIAAAIAAPIEAPAEAAPPPPRSSQPLTDVSVTPGALPLDPAGALQPVGVAPAAAIESVLDYAVVFFWPATPQTVADPVAIREGPADYARVIRAARPGERLRINGKVAAAPGGPWLRVRLADGRDGYFAARTVDVGAFRRRRAAEVETAAAGMADPAIVDGLGAPLIVDRTQPDDAEIGPPAF